MSDNNQGNDGGKGPWGKRSGNSGPDNNPWGKPRNTGGRNDQQAPDFDELLDKLNGLFSGGGNGRGGGKGDEGGRFFAVLAAIVVIVWLASGFYRVQPEEHGVILRFGEWNRTQEMPGLGYKAPWPIETIQKPNMTFQRRVEVGFRGNFRGGNRSGGYASVSDVPEESLMLTGDENIVDIDFVIVWNIKDAKNYLFNIRDPEMTIKKVAESAMREIIGQTDIQPILTKERTSIEIRTKELMQEMLNSYEAGVDIAAVQLQKVDPPSVVVDAFNDVQRARADKERLRNEAEAYRNDVIPRARGAAEKLLQEAEAYKEKVINQATGDADRFVSVYKAYSKAKDVTEKRLYLETMEEILQNSDKIIMDDKASKGGVVPYLPLNELNKNNSKGGK